MSRCQNLAMFILDVPPFCRSGLKDDLSPEEEMYAYTSDWANQTLFAAFALLGLRSSALAEKKIVFVGHSRGGLQLIKFPLEDLLNPNMGFFLLQPAVNQEYIYSLLTEAVKLSTIRIFGDLIQSIQDIAGTRLLIRTLLPGASPELRDNYERNVGESGNVAVAGAVHDLARNPLKTDRFTPEVQERIMEANIRAVLSLKDKLVTPLQAFEVLAGKVGLDPEKQIYAVKGGHCVWSLRPERKDHLTPPVLAEEEGIKGPVNLVADDLLIPFIEEDILGRKIAIPHDSATTHVLPSLKRR
jgi:hypothetical protein